MNNYQCYFCHSKMMHHTELSETYECLNIECNLFTNIYYTRFQFRIEDGEISYIGSIHENEGKINKIYLYTKQFAIMEFPTLKILFRAENKLKITNEEILNLKLSKYYLNKFLKLQAFN